MDERRGKETVSNGTEEMKRQAENNERKAETVRTWIYMEDDLTRKEGEIKSEPLAIREELETMDGNTRIWVRTGKHFREREVVLA